MPSDLFTQALAIEATDPESALKLYDRLIAEDSEHAAAHINAGTLHYSARRLQKAEKHYRRAIAIDPDYALAHFDLGNVLDETGKLEEAAEAYQRACKLNPLHADAHYNLALVLEKLHEPGRAIQHWKSYLAMDSTSPWSQHARSRINRAAVRYGIRVVRSNPSPRRTARRAKLALVSP